jgi:hypothetical protein
VIPAILLACCLVAPSGSVYDARGQRQGYIRESRPGQFDVYDQHSRRLGYGARAATARSSSSTRTAGGSSRFSQGARRRGRGR